MNMSSGDLASFDDVMNDGEEGFVLAIAYGGIVEKTFYSAKRWDYKDIAFATFYLRIVQNRQSVTRAVVRRNQPVPYSVYAHYDSRGFFI